MQAAARGARLSTVNVVVGTDGSDLAKKAASDGLALLKPADSIVVVTVVHAVDSSLADDATGHAGATMTHEEVEAQRLEAQRRGEAIVADLASELTAAGTWPARLDLRVLTGRPGPALCQLAAEVGAHVVVVGSRGRGGIRRALLGSVSDYVIRHAPCPVMVTRSG